MNSPSPRSRAYRLGREEDVEKGIRRIARGRVDDALERLEAARTDDFATGVHEARKNLKKLRSLLRLVRKGLGEAGYREASSQFREAARSLSGARDAEVKLQTLTALEERFPGELPDATLDPLRAALEAERPGNASAADLLALERAEQKIRSGRAGIARWQIDGGPKLISKGVERSYRRGRKMLAKVREDPTDHNVHEWRKRVKDLWYELRIVEESEPEVVKVQADLAHDVSTLIGDHHDLAILAEDVAARPEGLGGREERDALIARIDKRQSELVEEAIGLGKKLYAKKPKKFLRRIGLRD